MKKSAAQLRTAIAQKRKQEHRVSKKARNAEYDKKHAALMPIHSAIMSHLSFVERVLWGNPRFERGHLQYHLFSDDPLRSDISILAASSGSYEIATSSEISRTADIAEARFIASNSALDSQDLSDTNIWAGNARNLSRDQAVDIAVYYFALGISEKFRRYRSLAKGTAIIAAIILTPPALLFGITYIPRLLSN